MFSSLSESLFCGASLSFHPLGRRSKNQQQNARRETGGAGGGDRREDNFRFHDVPQFTIVHLL
jgi:hypothetical protein